MRHYKKPEGQGVSDELLWRMAQPGFIDIKVPNDTSKVMLYFNKHKYSTFWDGTFNQPVLPLADKMFPGSHRYY